MRYVNKTDHSFMHACFDIFAMCLVLFSCIQEQLLWYGIDWNGPINLDNENTVVVPPVNNLLPQDVQEILQREIDLADNIDPEQTYLAVRIFVHALT